MASVKAEKLVVMTQLFDPVKKTPAKTSDGGASKSTPASKADPNRNSKPKRKASPISIL